MLLLLCSLPLLACGTAADEAAGTDGRGGSGGGDLDRCFRDADCPSGLFCDLDGRCVDEDGLPPEEEEPLGQGRPVATPTKIFALDPAAHALTIIDADSLALRSVPVPEGPVDLATLPGEEAALVLSGSGSALSLLTVQEGELALEVWPTARPFGAVATSPDGAFALLWTPDDRLPAAGAEGIVARVDLRTLREGGEAALVEYAAGRRHQAIHFRSDGEGAVEAAVVGKEEIVLIPLAPEEEAQVERLALPEAFAEVATREVVAAPDGSWLLLRSMAGPELALLDVEGRSLSTLELPAPATDLDVAPDGSYAVAVLRSTGQVAILPLPAALADPAAMRLHPVELPATGCDEGVACTEAPGQVAIAPDGSFAALFTNAAPSESLALISPVDGSYTTFSHLQKLVQSVHPGERADRLLVVHRAEPDSTVADPYERQVDRAQGHSVIDLDSGVAQLKLTGALPPREVAFAAGGRYVAITLRGEEGFGLDAVDLETLLSESLPIASAPLYAGPLPAGGGEHRVWVTQQHPAGRISIVHLDEGRVRTITGFGLDGEVR